MPTALTVDQSFVDNYLARVDRFCKNVEDLGKSIQEFAGRFTVQEQAEPQYEETASNYREADYVEAAAAEETPEAVTADDIDLDSLLQGVDLDGGLTM